MRFDKIIITARARHSRTMDVEMKYMRIKLYTRIDRAWTTNHNTVTAKWWWNIYGGLWSIDKCKPNQNKNHSLNWTNFICPNLCIQSTDQVLQHNSVDVVNTKQLLIVQAIVGSFSFPYHSEITHSGVVILLWFTVYIDACIVLGLMHAKSWRSAMCVWITMLIPNRISIYTICRLFVLFYFFYFYFFFFFWI